MTTNKWITEHKKNIEVTGMVINNSLDTKNRRTINSVVLNSNVGGLVIYPQIVEIESSIIDGFKSQTETKHKPSYKEFQREFPWLSELNKLLESNLKVGIVTSYSHRTDEKGKDHICIFDNQLKLSYCDKIDKDTKKLDEMQDQKERAEMNNSDEDKV